MDATLWGHKEGALQEVPVFLVTYTSWLVEAKNRTRPPMSLKAAASQAMPLSCG